MLDVVADTKSMFQETALSKIILFYTKIYSTLFLLGGDYKLSLQK
jgi:hypothetical protein